MNIFESTAQELCTHLKRRPRKMGEDQAKDTTAEEPQSGVPVEDSDVQAIRDVETPLPDTEQLPDDQVKLSNTNQDYVPLANRTTNDLQERPRRHALHPLAKSATEHITLGILGTSRRGGRWALPLKACHTWEVRNPSYNPYSSKSHVDSVQGLRNAIEKTAGKNEEILKMVRAEEFDITLDDGTVVLPDFWEDLLQPKMTILLKSRKFGHCPGSLVLEEGIGAKGGAIGGLLNGTNETTQSESDGDSNVSHRVDYWRQDQFGSGVTSLIYAVNSNEPVQFVDASSKGQESSILQIIQVIQRLADPNKPGSKPGASIPPIPSLNVPKSLELGKGESLGRKELIIHSPYLLNVLGAVVKYSTTPPSGRLDGLKQGRFQFPFHDLCYYRDDFQAYKIAHEARERHTTEYNDKTDHHIDVLLDYLYSEQDIHLKETEERWSRKYPTTTFESAWLLFKPGTDVYVPEAGTWSAYVVDSIFCGSAQMFSRRIAIPYKVDAWNLAFNGTVITRQLRRIEIPVFDGEREISSLPVFPCRFIREDLCSSTVRTRLIQRGLKYMALVQGPAYREYELEPGTEKVGCKLLLTGVS